MEDLFAANPRNLKLPTTGPALLRVARHSGIIRQTLVAPSHVHLTCRRLSILRILSMR